MSIENKLLRITSTYKSDARLIGQFVSDTEISLVEKQNIRENFDIEEKSQVSAFADALEKALNSNGIGTPVVPLPASERVSAYIMQVLTPIKQREFLAEMSLSYLIAHQEAFIKDYVFQLLLHKRQLLKSNATATYEEITSHRSMRSLWSVLAQKEVDALGYGSIDEVSLFFSKKLNINLSNYKNWDSLREHNYRRNLIIHNRSLINDTYRKKVGSKQKSGRLVTNMTYVNRAVDNLIGFIDFVHDSVSSKFKLGQLKVTSSMNAKRSVKKRKD